ncbi:YdeI/OmpD-associated family protein [Rubrivirga sp.]|uniref:YdeI/OmpD-associated family protein n=1 Tax=Rubrivirga sp. TaxID=1885344 RepID=UPI003C7306D6
MPDLPERHVHPLSRAEWRAWLREHSLEDDGVWLVRYKKATGKPTVTWDDVVEEAIAFGWIDSVPRKLDGERSLLYVSPRKSGSNWSRLSKTRAERMIEAGQMTAAGQAAIDRAKADGTWAVLEDVENLIVPPDLASALEAAPPAREEWDGFPPSTRRGILEWVLNAKRDTTRAKRVHETARLAQQGKRANRWPRET